MRAFGDGVTGRVPEAPQRDQNRRDKRELTVRARFETSNGTLSGSFAEGTSVSQGNVDFDTIAVFTQVPPTSSTPMRKHW